MDRNSDFNTLSDENPNANFSNPNISTGEDFLEVDEGRDTMEDESYGEDEDEDENENLDDQTNEIEPKNQTKSSEHDGKFLVVQKGLACCDKGSKFPSFKVTSHQKHYWNDEDGNADYLVVTEDDLNFSPLGMPFVSCSVKNGNPCAFAPSGKWTNTYEKVKVSGKNCVTEISELLCSVGGKITVMKHGQQTEAGKSNANNANSQEQQTYNPMIDFEEFKEEINQADQLYYT